MFARLLALSTLGACCAAAASGADVRCSAYSDALRKTCQSLAIVGPIAFGWSAGPLALQPANAMRVGLRNAQRWGGTSAGFTGGRAMTQVFRETDDVWCSVAGAAAAALLGAASFGQIPTRLAGFVVMSYVLETQLLPRAGLVASSARLDRPEPKKRGRAARPPDWTYGGGARAPWGTHTPWAGTVVGRMVIRIDRSRQDFEDACVAHLGGPAGSRGR